MRSDARHKFEFFGENSWRSLQHSSQTLAEALLAHGLGKIPRGPACLFRRTKSVHFSTRLTKNNDTVRVVSMSSDDEFGTTMD